MDNKQNENEEITKIRHTIKAEEAFTLAKDVFDLRCFIKNVYSNRAVISRRLNILTLTFSTLFMILYSAYVLFTGLTKKLAVQMEIVLYVMLGAYAVLFIALIIATVCGNRAKTKSVIKYKKVLSVFKIFVRLLSVAVSITAMVFSASGGELAASKVAFDVIIIVFSVITLIVQIIPLMFGGLGKLVRWLLSPVKIKYRFSAVILEWYELAVSGNANGGAVKKVSKKYFDDIGIIIDNYLIPALGKKYINTIKPVQLLNVIDKSDEADKPVLEGILKNVFAYAEECGYVVFNPCNDLGLEGSVEEEEKPKKHTMKGRLLNVGKKIGKSMLEKYIIDSVDDSADSK